MFPRNHHRKEREARRMKYRVAGEIKVRPGVDPDDPLVHRRCTGKRGKYDNRKKAKGAAALASKRHGVVFHSYHCGYCGHFHLSSTKAGDQGERDARS